jgi:hypothetical protein
VQEFTTFENALFPDGAYQFYSLVDEFLVLDHSSFEIVKKNLLDNVLPDLIWLQLPLSPSLRYRRNYLFLNDTTIYCPRCVIVMVDDNRFYFNNSTIVHMCGIRMRNTFCKFRPPGMIQS